MLIIAMNMFDIAAKLVVVASSALSCVIGFYVEGSLHSGPPD
jgi:hypothetical protein